MASPKLIPVDSDPFAQASNAAGPQLVPVDHDPFQDTQAAPSVPSGMATGRNVGSQPVTSMGRFHSVPATSTALPAYDRFMKGLKDPVNAAAQLLTRALPTGAVNAVNNATAT